MAGQRPTRLRAYDWQLVLRGVTVAVYGFLLAAYEWPYLTGSTLLAGVLLLAAAVCGLVGLWRPAVGRDAFWLRLVDVGLDLVGGGVLVGVAAIAPAVGPLAFGVWAVAAGLVLVIHCLPTRAHDVGPAWAWIWTGVPLVLTGAAVLGYPQLDPVADALRLNAFGLAAATMLCLLGFGLAYPYVLQVPARDTPNETMFTYDDVRFRPTPPDLEAPHDLQRPGGRAA